MGRHSRAGDRWTATWSVRSTGVATAAAVDLAEEDARAFYDRLQVGDEVQVR